MSYTRATSIEEACRAEGEFRAAGTDLQERLHAKSTADGIIDIADIPGLDRIEHAATGTTIGASVTINGIGNDPQLQRDYPALTLPAQTLATPQIRQRATLGGVLCQRTRCWYYRHPDLACPKKGDDCECPARKGNNHFGVCFDLGPCVFPHPSSMALSLLCYEAEIEVTGRGKIATAALYGDGSDVTRDHTLDPGELITAVHLPPAAKGEKAYYVRQMSREWAEWPLVEVVVRLILDGSTIRDAKVAIGGVANIPLRLEEVEKALVGKQAGSTDFESVASLAIANATPSEQTAYKLPMVTACVLEALEGALANDDGGKLCL